MELNTNKLREITKDLQEYEKSLTVYMDNVKWEMHLPLFEKMMIFDHMKDYKAEALGLGKEEYEKYEKISIVYKSLKDYYQYKVPEIKKQMEAGLNAYAPYDINITLDEACKKYNQVDIETAQKIDAIVDTLDEKAMYHEKEIREAYQGDLANQLGINKEAYIKNESDLFDTFNNFMNENENRFQEIIDQNANKDNELEENIAPRL